MALEQIKVFVSELQPGMYVSELDRPWRDTPFKIQGFMIRSDDDVIDLNRYCDYVYIDTLKSRNNLVAADHHKAELTDWQQKKVLISQTPVKYEENRNSTVS